MEREALEKSPRTRVWADFGHGGRMERATHFEFNAATLSNRLIGKWLEWCPETESNRHVLLRTRDFKPYSAARPRPFPSYRLVVSAAWRV